MSDTVFVRGVDWDVFDTGMDLRVQRVDRAKTMADDDEAIAEARRCGVVCDNNGVVETHKRKETPFKEDLIHDICRLAADYEQLMQERDISMEKGVIAEIIPGEDIRPVETIDEEIDSIMDQTMDAAQKMRYLLYPDDES